jgi:glutamate 5-kinase
MGRKTSEIQQLLGARDYDEVVHRDNLVLMS